MQGFSEHITDVLVNSWRPATQKQYTVYIKKWAIFSSTKKNRSVFARFKRCVGVLLEVKTSLRCFVRVF